MRRPSSLRSSLGTAIHAGTAAFDQARLEQNPIRPDDAADVFIDALRNPEDEVDYQGDNITLNDAEIIGLALTVKYCVDIAPKFRFKSVEMKLNPLAVDCGNGVTIRLTGTMDRARTAYYETLPIEGSENELLIPSQAGGIVVPPQAGGIVIPDIKSGARIIEDGQVSLKGKSAQLGAYQLMYEDTAGEPTIGGQIIALQTTRKAETGVSRIVDGKRVMWGTNTDKGLIEMAAVMFKSGFFPPNPQSQLCSQKFCARWTTCIYHD